MPPSAPASPARSCLIIVAHPRLDQSVVNRRLLEEVRDLPGVVVHDLYATYPSGHLGGGMDLERERALLQSADSVVLQFPFYWYSSPALLKEWQDQVLTSAFYHHYDAVGATLAGKPVMVAVTAGADASTYGSEGRNRYSMEHLLAPLAATVWRCDLDWRPPFVVYAAGRTPEETGAAAHLYRARIEQLLAGHG